MAYVVPDILRQIEDFGIHEERIRRMIILHSHFDHCGIIPYFKKRWPWTTVCASVRGKQLLDEDKISQNVAFLNQQAVVKAGLEDMEKELGFAFTRIDVEETLSEGAVIACGDLTLEIIEVPGHSSCSIAVYIPQEKALFASDAGGIRCEDSFYAAGSSNYDLYEQSLEKMAGYDLNVVLGEHYGASIGEDAQAFFPNSIKAAKQTRVLIEESYARTRDIEKSTEELIDLFLGEAPDDFLPREVWGLVVAQMVRHIAKGMEE